MQHGQQQIGIKMYARRPLPYELEEVDDERTGK